jgi:hypothetical protein
LPTAQLIDGPFAVATHSVTPKGITTDLVHVYIGDVSDATIDVYASNGAYIRSFSVAGQTGFPQGITFSRITRDLCVVDGQGGNKVSEFTLDGDFVQNFTLNGTSQNGLACDPDRCSYWAYDRGTDTVRHYDPDVVEIGSFPGTPAAGAGLGEGVAVIGDRLYVIAAPPGWPTVIVFDVTDAMEACTIFADGFDGGGMSCWNGGGPSRERQGERSTVGVAGPRRGSPLSPSLLPSSSPLLRHLLEPVRRSRAPCDAVRYRSTTPAAEKYVQSGWWKTIAETDASGSIIMPSVSPTPMSAGCSSSNRAAWSSRSGQAG